MGSTWKRGWQWGMIVSILVCFPAIAAAQNSILPKQCVDCHGTESKYGVRGARTQYATSGHKNLGNAWYANSDDCQGCHTNEGFVERANKGRVDTKKFVRYPSEIGCFTCHAPHENGNFTLRTTAAVKLANGATFDRGKGNLCASCHQARRTAKDEVKARAIPTASWGAHHGPQADMLAGTNAYELPGKKYAKSPHAALPQAECVTCHMTLPNGRYSLAPGIGGHSFNLEGEVHEERVVNTAGCLTSGCHSEMKQLKGTPFFDRQAAADYDGNGKIEAVQQEVQGLYERLINNKGTGLLQTMKNPIYDTKGNFIENNKTQYPVEVVGALYNYKFVKEDGSKGIHNTAYAIQLLIDSIKSLDKNFDDSKRPQ